MPDDYETQMIRVNCLKLAIKTFDMDNPIDIDELFAATERIYKYVSEGTFETEPKQE